MKRLLLLLLSAIMALSCVFVSACIPDSSHPAEQEGTEQNKTDEDEKPEGDGGNTQGNGEDGGEEEFVNDNPLVTYYSEGYPTQIYEINTADGADVKTATLPVWQTRSVYNETVTFLGKNDKAKLLYTPTRIISVRDYSLTEEYAEGVDYTISGNVLSLTANTRVNCWSLLEYYSKGVELTWLDHVNGVDQIYMSETVPTERQIRVTYEHAENWKGPVPVGQSDRFGKTVSALNAGETVNIGLLGDSISVGAGSSEQLQKQPYGKSYANLIRSYLTARFPNADINFTNKSKGGMGSAWGASKDADKGIGQFISSGFTPDLFIIAWGMNDYSLTPEQYKENIESIILTAKEINPNCEILLVSTMIPNPEVAGFTGSIPYLEEKLIELFGGETTTAVKTALGETRLGVAPMTAFSTYLYKTTKRYPDIGSNNVNHPNDFLHGIYAQVILKTLLGDGFTVLD